MAFVRAIGVAALLVAALLVAWSWPSPGFVARPPSAAPTFATSPSPTPTPDTASTSASAPIPDGFRVRVPRLRIDLPIAEGIIQRDVELQQTPEGYAFHLPGTAVPGRPGNAYIYSHARVGMFLPLWDARVGDEVIVTTPDGRTLAYVVSEVRPRVPPTDTTVAQPTADERLTLQTSTGPTPSDPRFVVIALPRS